MVLRGTESFRNKNKVFPVVLKGTSSIGDSRRFIFTIQNAVKKALLDKNMRVAVPSEFENMISEFLGTEQKNLSFHNL